jgi:hypothetical protein
MQIHVALSSAQYDAEQTTLQKARWACPGFVDRLTLSVLFFSHDGDEALW